MRGPFHFREMIMEELIRDLRREPAGALLWTANVVGLVLVAWLLAIAS